MDSEASRRPAARSSPTRASIPARFVLGGIRDPASVRNTAWGKVSSAAATPASAAWKFKPCRDPCREPRHARRYRGPRSPLLPERDLAARARANLAKLSSGCRGARPRWTVPRERRMPPRHPTVDAQATIRPRSRSGNDPRRGDDGAVGTTSSTQWSSSPATSIPRPWAEPGTPPSSARPSLPSFRESFDAGPRPVSITSSLEAVAVRRRASPRIRCLAPRAPRAARRSPAPCSPGCGARHER